MSTLREQYEEAQSRLHKAMAASVQALSDLATELKVPPAQPLSARVKTWDSIEKKLSRLARLKIDSIAELEDLIGMRAVFLFSSDVATFGSAIHRRFSVANVRLSTERSGVDRFGYASDHYILRLDDGLLAELQVRTLAQHVWAEASHRLYYKSERLPPSELQRSMHRTSAMLEVVDHELERLRKERDEYVRAHGPLPEFEDQEQLSIIGVQLVLHEMLPEQHFVENDHYFGLMTELLHLNIDTFGELRQLIRENLAPALDKEQQAMRLMLADPKVDERAKARIRATGRYCSQVALVRTMLILKFGDRYHVFDPSKWRETQ